MLDFYAAILEDLQIRLERLESLVSPDDHSARLELVDVRRRMTAAEFALDVSRDLDALPLDGPDDDFGDDPWP